MNKKSCKSIGVSTRGHTAKQSAYTLFRIIPRNCNEIPAVWDNLNTQQRKFWEPPPVENNRKLCIFIWLGHSM
jgi:hypothetical protein